MNQSNESRPMLFGALVARSDTPAHGSTAFGGRSGYRSGKAAPVLISLALLSLLWVVASVA